MADESIERDDERDDEVEAHQLGELRQSEMRQTELLKDEEEHVDWLEAQLHQIKEMGYERYLSN